MNKKYQIIYADPPWKCDIFRIGKDKGRTFDIYPTMTTQNIRNIGISLRPYLADNSCLFLWTTNAFLHDAFHVIEAWGFKYMMVITWVKKSGCGIYWVSTTQPLLFAYKGKCKFPLAKLKPTHLITPPPRKHSQKPNEFYDLIESISPEPRLELFARNKRDGWDCWGNEVDSDIVL